MDRINIGKFIATCRKAKKPTQEQLAEMLGITNKSISKWENGICLPDASLYKPLCVILNVSVNELFEGQRIEGAERQRDTNGNLMQMLKYKLYRLSDRSISFQAFDHALSEVADLTTRLKEFPTKGEAVRFLTEQTGESAKICNQAYDFYMGLFQTGESEEPEA